MGVMGPSVLLAKELELAKTGWRCRMCGKESLDARKIKTHIIYERQEILLSVQKWEEAGGIFRYLARRAFDSLISAEKRAS